MADLFISYSRRDQQFVRELVESLSARGKECWVDWQDIPLTAEWIQEIYQGIEGTDAFVFVISPESARSETCRDEIEHAQGLNKRIVPILRRDVDGVELPDAIASRNWIPFPESADLDEGVDRVVEVMEHDLEHVQRHTRGLEKALEWDKRERDSSLLLRGAELRSAEEWLAGAAEREPAPTPLHYEHARASRASATKRLRLVIVAFAFAFVLTAALAVFALIQRNRERVARQTAESRLVASEALGQLDDKLDAGASRAVAAYRIRPTSEARDSALVAMRRSGHVRAVLDSGCAKVNVVRFSPNGALLAAGCDEGTVVVWEPLRGRTIARVQVSGAPVRSLAFSTDSQLLAAADSKQAVRLWRARLDGVEALGGAGLQASAIAFAPDQTLVLATTGGISTWRQGGDVHRAARLLFPVDRIVAAEDGSVAAGGPYGATLLQRGKGKQLPAEMVGGDQVVQDLAFAPTGERLAIVEGQQVVVGTRGRKNVKLLPLANATAVAIGPTGGIVTGNLDGDVAVWDREGKRQLVFRLRRGSAVTSVAYDPNHDVVASTSSGQIALWSVSGVQLQRSLSMPLEVLDALVLTDTQTLFAGGEQDGRGRIVRQDIASNSQTTLRDAPESPISLASAQNGRVVAAGGSSQVVVWTPQGRQRPLSRPGDTTLAVAASAEGTTVAQATQHGTLNLWDWESSRPPDVLDISPVELTAVAAAPSGLQFAVGDVKGGLWLVDADKKRSETIGKLDHPGVDALTFAGGADRIVVTGSDGTITVWNVRSKSERVFRRSDLRLRSVAVDPSGSTIAAGDDQGNIFLWDARKGDQLGPPIGLEGEVVSMGFDPSGHVLGIGLNGGTVVLLAREAWDVTAAIDSLCMRLARC